MSDREQSPPMDVACEVDDGVKRRPADGVKRRPAKGGQAAKDGGKRQPADGEQAAPDGVKQQVDGEQKGLNDDKLNERDNENDESNGEEEETDNGDGEMNESDNEANESDDEGNESAASRNAGRDNTADEAPRGQYDYVYLRLISDIHPDEGFLVKTTEPMRNMKQLHHSQLNETQKQSLKQYFLYNGNLITDEDTPQSLGLKETDDIHVFHTMGEGIRVHTIETGEVRQLQL